MKKIVLFLVIFLSGNLILNAECTLKREKELNILANYVNYIYEYNESTGKFDITFNNFLDGFTLAYDNKVYVPSGGSLVISNLDLGARFNADIVINMEGCILGSVRNINIRLPFKNKYYNSSLCNGHEDLNVCSYRFLEYNLSETTFFGLLENDNKNNKDDKEEDIENPPIKDNLIDVAVNQVKKYYIPVIVLIVSSGIMISIYSVIIRKIKHGL